MDIELVVLMGLVLVALATATGVCALLRFMGGASVDAGLLDRFLARLRAWWLLFAALAGALILGKAATVVLFGLLSFWALREFITVTPTRLSDHRALFWVFFVFLPLQYVLVGLGFYDFYLTLIPVYALLLVPARVALSGDATRFLERTAKIQAGLLLCVYCLSFAPALLSLEWHRPVHLSEPTVPKPSLEELVYLQWDAAAAGGSHASTSDVGNGSTELVAAASWARHPTTGAVVASAAQPVWGKAAAWEKVRLLFFLIVLVQLSDVLQYGFSKLFRGHLVAPTIHPSRTWEGFAAGTACVVVIGTALWFATPFPHWWQASLAALVTAAMSFAGAMTMSAIKRDRGVRDYGVLIEGHGGVLDRIDSLCFAAPVFFHVSRYFLGAA